MSMKATRLPISTGAGKTVAMLQASLAIRWARPDTTRATRLTPTNGTK